MRNRPTFVLCGVCGTTVPVAPLGPVPTTCSAACRQRRYRATQPAVPHLLAVAIDDLVPGDFVWDPATGERWTVTPAGTGHFAARCLGLRWVNPTTARTARS